MERLTRIEWKTNKGARKSKKKSKKNVAVDAKIPIPIAATTLEMTACTRRV